jgi:osmotically inducible protein OsmC
MAGLHRTAEAAWNGDLRTGNGRMASGSGVLEGVPYSFATRFQNEPGTNPEELIAAAHAACFSMAFAATLGDKGYSPVRIETHATCTVSPQKGGGFRITKMRLVTRGQVPGLDEEAFKQIAVEAEQGCPVSNALRGGPMIELEATLV